MVTVIACDKRKAFAHGSVSDEAIQSLRVILERFVSARDDDEGQRRHHRILVYFARTTAGASRSASVSASVAPSVVSTVA
jgi:hypothetical protein